jgi:hypothetical protein
MCERVSLPNGTVAIVCGVRRHRKRCTHCRDWAGFECDACDVPLCRRCRIHVPPDKDFCRSHRAEARAAAAELRVGSTGNSPPPGGLAESHGGD